ncbi:hypothetical protein [Prosthecochloris sp.]|uniref:hypothetical protein n=1 Tax=Prosthecochloris sp. TaxID=290513 RepID=UPI0025F7CA07|nr:hypothetical protein [Prosthecochloris sp.]
MKKGLQVTFVLVLFFSATTGLADTTIDNQAVSQSQSTSVAENNNGGDGGEGGAASASISFKGSSSSPAPYMPGTVTGPVGLPSLFNLIGRPAQLTGLALQSKHFFAPTCHRVETGESGGTKIVYTGAKPASRKEIKERDVYFDFSGVGQGELVGSITIQSKKTKADEVDLHTLIFDATQFAAGIKELRGYDITLLSIPQAISWGVGVDAKGDGLSISPVLSSLLNGPSGVLTGLASGFSQTGGVSVPTGIVGCTFLVLIDNEKTQTIDIRHAYVNNGNGNGKENGSGNGKKLEAIEAQETK